jgi:hypothetical protein
MNFRTVLRAAAAAGLIGAGGGIVVAGPVVWDTASGGNGNSYEVVMDDAASWDAARSAAQSAGGDLATITSPAEQSFVESVLGSAGAHTGSYWFGIRETAVEGTYANVTGEPLTFTHWNTVEPNNAGDIENVGAVLWTTDGSDAGLLARRGHWNDEPVAGYPTDGFLMPSEADVFRAGYLIEIAADNGGTGGGNGNGGGGPNAVPLPAAVFTFPAAAAFAGIFYRRMKRGT